ncbi:MAG: hypothetical protein WAP74_01880 [Patescibacteria group bacterium]
MRVLQLNHTGHTKVSELTREQIESMTAEQREAEIKKIRKWADGEIDKGRLVVAVQKQGADGVQVHKGDNPSLDTFQYESHSPLVGG